MSKRSDIRTDIKGNINKFTHIGKVDGNVIICGSDPPIKKKKELQSLIFGDLFNLSRKKLLNYRKVYFQTIESNNFYHSELRSCGIILFSLGMHNEAKNLLSKSIELDPFDAYCWYSLAICSLKGERPRNLDGRRKAINTIDYAARAFNIDSSQAHICLLLSAIREDYFEYYRYLIDVPSLEECFDGIDEKQISLHELKALKSFIKIPSGKTIDVINILTK